MKTHAVFPIGQVFTRPARIVLEEKADGWPEVYFVRLLTSDGKPRKVRFRITLGQLIEQGWVPE